MAQPKGTPPPKKTGVQNFDRVREAAELEAIITGMRQWKTIPDGTVFEEDIARYERTLMIFIYSGFGCILLVVLIECFLLYRSL